jgi:hypothetical protein
VQNSKIHNELGEAILKSERLESWLGKRKEWEMQTLGLIYASGARGLHLLELESNLEIDQKSLKAFLNEAISEIFIWHAKCQNFFIYYGFSDFENAFLKSLIKNDESETATWISNDRKAELHLILILSKIQLGKISVKKDHSLSSLSKKHMAEIFNLNKESKIDKAAEDEISLLFSFLVSQKWVTKNMETGELMLLPEVFCFLQKNGFRLFSELIFWWECERFKGSLQKLLGFFEKPLDALSAAQLLWPYDTHSRLPKNKSAISWITLPLPLRELYILGILKMQKKKHITTFSLSEYGRMIFFAKQSHHSISEPIIACSSNFEWLISQNNGPLKIFQMSCFAQIKNKEDPLRFALNRESFLGGLRSGLPSDYIQDFLFWNKAASNVAVALADWSRIHSDSSIDTLRILRINKPEKFAELAAYKPFTDCTDESIPNWGFVIKPEYERRIRDILLHFSLEPSSAIDPQNIQLLSELTETANFKLPHPAPNGGPIFL